MSLTQLLVGSGIPESPSYGVGERAEADRDRGVFGGDHRPVNGRQKSLVYGGECDRR